MDVQSRPFGVALLVAGVDEKGPVLYHTDPSGTFTRYEAKAIGAGSEGAQTYLQEHYNKVQRPLFVSRFFIALTLHPLTFLRWVCIAVHETA